MYVSVCVCDQRQRESGRTCRLCVYPASHASEAYVHTCVSVCECVSARGWSRPLNHPRPRQSMPHAAHEKEAPTAHIDEKEEPMKIDQCISIRLGCGFRFGSSLSFMALLIGFYSNDRVLPTFERSS